MESRSPKVNPAVFWVLLPFLGLCLLFAWRVVDRGWSPAKEREARDAAGQEGSATSESAAGDGSYRHRDWTGADPDAGPRTASAGRRGSAGRAPQTDLDDQGPPDPQVLAMRRSFPDDVDAGVPMPFPPAQLGARITVATGDRDIAAGMACDLRILPVRAGRFNCVVRVLCGGELLYPNPTQTAGYVPCTVGEDGSVTRAVDRGATHRDGDPRLDYAGDYVIVDDDGGDVAPFRAVLAISG